MRTVFCRACQQLSPVSLSLLRARITGEPQPRPAAMDGPDQDENGEQLVTRSSKIGSILKVLPRDKFTKLGQPAYPDQPSGPKLTPKFLIRRNSEFCSHAHVFGGLVALLSLTYCCENYGLDFSKWPDVHKQHFFHRCSQYYKKNSSSFPECIRTMMIPR